MGAGSTNAVHRAVPIVVVGWILGSSVSAGAAPSSEDPVPRRTPVVAGAHYAEVSRLHRFFFGDDYRDLWALPVQVEVLDLRRFAGGLTPVRQVGQQQSRGLALRGADGRSYTFRGIEKDATTGLEPDLRRSVAGRIAQDQIAALHPDAPPVAAALLEAAGVLNVEVRLVVMPDDERLGAFRGAFGGILGTIQEYPTPASDGHAGFAGATAIVDGEEMLARRRASPDDRVDARAFLRARLMDLFLGDWDRHLGQWRFARVPWSAEWQPIPEDRDFAFSRFEGSVLFVARNWRPRWVAFGDEYPDMLGLTWQAWPLDRLLLSELERPAWDEVTADLERRLSDEVIDAAIRRLPPEYLAADGARMKRALERRRDRLGEAADRFYRLLSQEVRVEGSDEPDAAEAVALDGGDLLVRLYRQGPSGVRVGEPWFQRHFRRRETSEVRLDLRGGNDDTVVRGRSGIRLRVLGGEGDDVLDDSEGGTTWFVDWQGHDRVVSGSRTKIDARPYTAPVHDPARPWIPPRDWGGQRTYVPWFGASPDIGAFIGGGVRLERFAFRAHPYGRRQTLRAGFATGPRAFKLDYEGEFRRDNSGIFLTLAARASQLELLRFFGFGNDTTSGEADGFYRVEQRQLSLASRLDVALSPRLTLSLGPTIQHASTRRPPGRFITEARPYGSEGFGALGAAAQVVLDTRDLMEAATRGVRVVVGGAFHPAVWDVEEHFGEVHAEAASYVTAPLLLSPTLALRAGVKQVFGTYPFHEATFVGGDETVRGFSSQRFAGDGGAWGNAELRLFLGRYFLVLPGEYGLFALADAGRVWIEAERSSRWHTGVGGGLWFAYVERTNTVTVAVARSAEGTGVYVRAGFLY